ncbi:MAG: RNA 2',3'-cyclic phosphodiesterase, partial [Terriglobales bacterium]
MRLFVALDIDESIRARLAQFVQGVQRFAPDARWISPESLHLTLKFIGEVDPGELGAVQNALAGVQAVATAVRIHRTGFFPSARAARVFWVGVQSDARLTALAEAVEQALVPLGIAREERAYSPHLTLARSGSGRPGRKPDDRANTRFRLLEQK